MGVIVLVRRQKNTILIQNILPRAVTNDYCQYQLMCSLILIMLVVWHYGWQCQSVIDFYWMDCHEIYFVKTSNGRPIHWFLRYFRH